MQVEDFANRLEVEATFAVTNHVEHSEVVVIKSRLSSTVQRLDSNVAVASV